MTRVAWPAWVRRRCFARGAMPGFTQQDNLIPWHLQKTFKKEACGHGEDVEEKNRLHVRLEHCSAPGVLLAWSLCLAWPWCLGAQALRRRLLQPGTSPSLAPTWHALVALTCQLLQPCVLPPRSQGGTVQHRAGEQEAACLPPRPRACGRRASCALILCAVSRASSAPIALSPACGSVVYKRFYHMFVQGESDRLLGAPAWQARVQLEAASRALLGACSCAAPAAVIVCMQFLHAVWCLPRARPAYSSVCQRIVSIARLGQRPQSRSGQDEGGSMRSLVAWSWQSWQAAAGWSRRTLTRKTGVSWASSSDVRALDLEPRGGGFVRPTASLLCGR